MITPYCWTCHKYFKPLGIARHRAMHRDNNQDCEITTKEGRIRYSYSERKKKLDGEPNTI